MRILSLIVVLTLLAGCAASSQSRVATYASPALLTETPARIVVVPFDAGRCSRENAAVVSQAVSLAVQDTLQVDVVSASPRDERLTAESVLWRRGRVDVGALVEAQRDYMADAFLFGAITNYKPYEPPILGLKLRLLSARTGDVLWAAEGVFDARDRDVRETVIDYFKRSGLRGKLVGSEFIFMSPTQYATFVAQEMLQPLRGKFARLQAKARQDQR